MEESAPHVVGNIGSLALQKPYNMAIHEHGRLDFDSSPPDPRFALDMLFTKGPGRMIGVLVAIDQKGCSHVLKAFSGQIGETWHIPGWVGPVAGITNTSAVYVRTRSTIEHMSAQLQRLEAARAHPQHHNRQQQQARSRNPLTIPSATTTAGDSSNSTRSNGASVQFKLQQRQLLKSRRKCLSHHLLQQIQRSYITTDFAGQQVCLLKVYLQYVAQYETQLPVTRAGTFVGMPAGAGDCCAPKLLHAAVTAGLMPTGMAEVWCGSAPGTATKAKTGRPIPVDGLDPTSSRLHMELYGMCDKCKALLGTMLCGYSGLE